MKQNIFILIFLISLSHFAFGQDTINYLKKFSLPICKILNETQTLLQNTYELNRQERDSIWLFIEEEDRTQALLNNWKYSQSIAIFHSQNLLHLMAVLNSKTVDRSIKQNLIIGKIEYDETQVKEGEDPYYIFSRCGLIEEPRFESYSSKKDAVQDYIRAHSEVHTNFFLIPRVIFVGEDLKKGKKFVRIDNKGEIALKKTLNFIRKLEISNVELLIPPPTAVFGGKAGLTIYYLKKYSNQN